MLLAMSVGAFGAAFAHLAFWLTVVLSLAGSALSAFCVYDPIQDAKQDPYAFTGQWFIWLATPLLWATVAASSAFSWLEPFDLLGVLFALGISRYGAHAICELQWRARGRRVLRYPYLPHAERHF